MTPAFAILLLLQAGPTPGAAARPAIPSRQVEAARQPSKIDLTKHNFFGPEKRSQDPNLDLCQFCHVPQRKRVASAPPPLWDGALQGELAALDVRADPNGPPKLLRWGGSSLRCLTCHDATVSSINITYRPTSVSLSKDEVAADRHRAEGMRPTYLAAPDEPTGLVMGNHPVGIPYPLELGQSEYRRYDPRASLLPWKEWNPDPRDAGLKLFTDTSGFDVPSGRAGIECASCHDPHGTGNKYFLRVTKERSALCLGCHRK